MKKIIFVCLGNICRSPMAEMIMKKMLNDTGSNQIIVESKATSTYELGNSPHPGAIAELTKHNVPIVEHHSQQITTQDFKSADLIIGMDYQNLDDLQRMAPDQDKYKLHIAYESVNEGRVIEDPWFDHNFDRTYRQLAEVLPNWLKILQEQ